MRSRSALLLGVQRLLAREHADPRIPQLLFGIPVAFDLIFVLARKHAGLHGDLLTSYQVGLGCFVAATLLAVVIGRDWFGERWSVLVPMLDIVAVGLLRIDPASSVGIALVLPVGWLGLQFGRRGMALGVLTLAPVYVVPILLRSETSASLSRAVQQVLVALLGAALATLTTERWQETARSAEKTQRMLERAVGDSAEQRRFNEAILNSVDVGLLALDASGRVHSMNPRHRRFLELVHPAGLGEQLDQVGETFGADGFTELAEGELPSWRAVHGETLRDYLIWVGADPATRRAFAVSVSPFFTPSGDFDGAVLAYHDITELMTAARMKDEFVATVSHELRTPLTSIVGYVDVLLEDVDDLPREAVPFLETVQRNARRLHRLVDDLLSDALKLGRAELHLGRISLASVVRACAVEAEKAARTAGLTLEMDVGRAVLEIDGDAERLSQVIDNIFNNAIKFTPSGGRITGYLQREGRDAVVRISDTGRGIPPEELEDVFMKFFRSPGVQVDAIPGTGLGLAISKTIIEAHGGRIEVSSTVGVGTTLEVRLPLAGPRVARTG